MAAPDKIYINNYNGNDTWGNQWHSKPSQSPSVVSHEYIRKDALLELVKLAYGKVSMNPFDCSDAFEELIDKLNSL